MNAPTTTQAREADQLWRLNEILGPDRALGSLSDLASLPVTRKDELLSAQAENPPFGSHKPAGISHIFQSPGPIYEPGIAGKDFWRFGKFAAAIGLSHADIVQNTFSYHFTPAGAMFEAAARAVDAVVFPAGPGNTRQQAEVAANIGTTAYAGTPDFLGLILEKGDEVGLDLSRIRRAAVSAGPLFPTLRQAYADRGIMCRQCYGTADVGLIAYENADYTDAMFVDSDVILEIVSPGSGDPVPAGEIGEVVVTVLDPAHPLIRFSVGDLSAIATDSDAPNPELMRIVGWRGRADQATKVRGMFIRPEQVSSIVKRCDGVDRARVEVSFDGKSDRIEAKLETAADSCEPYAAVVQELLNLRADITLVKPGKLPRDGVLVADLREVAGS